MQIAVCALKCISAPRRMTVVSVHRGNQVCLNKMYFLLPFCFCCTAQPE